MTCTEDAFTLNTYSSAFTPYDDISPRSSWSSVMTATTGHGSLGKQNYRLLNVLKKYILLRCTMHEFCCEEDFDDGALETLYRMPLLQALQSVEYYSSNVNKAIIKKTAYLMGILNGQQEHWHKMLVTSYKSSSVDLMEDLLEYIGQCCLHGNCFPSDFTPEICLRLQSMSMHLASKAISAFNSNKRIVAGPKGGVINRSRFFLRLIQNVAEQAKPTPLRASPNTCTSFSNRSGGPPEYDICGEFLSLAIEEPKVNQSQRIKELERDIVIREQREKQLLQQMKEMKARLYHLQTECEKLKCQNKTFDPLHFSYFD